MIIQPKSYGLKIYLLVQNLLLYIHQLLKKEYYLDFSPQQILYYIPLMFLLAVYFQSHSPTDKRIMKVIFHIFC